MDISGTVAEIQRLYEGVGQTGYIGEPVSKTQHSLQCAMWAEREGATHQVVLAAFLHDIGHLIGQDQNLPEMITDDVNIGTQNHDVIGGEYLRQHGFPPLVCDIVGGHVNAKRYLVYKYTDYANKLSDASKKTLVHQGGKMSPEEAATFESSASFDAIIKMRRWDELAKDPNAKLDPLSKYSSLCERVLRKHQEAILN